MELWPDSERKSFLSNLTDQEALSLKYNWSFWARPSQKIPEGIWLTWLLRSGRGFGKTRTGAETVIQWALDGFSPIALVGETKADVRDVMIELGDSSIMKVAPPWFYPEYEPSKRRLTFPNGTVCISYSGDEPGQLRGPQHQKAWVDELAKFKYPRETWDNLEFGLRQGTKPQIICTTTPRPIQIIKEIVADPRTKESRGNTFENAANLNPFFLDRMVTKYQGTRLGRQELNGDILDDNPNALWKRSDIDLYRVSQHPDLDKVYVGVDPAGSTNKDAADTGIVVAGVNLKLIDPTTLKKIPHFYVLGDYTIHGTPLEWARAAVSAYHIHKADKIIGEINYGGEMVEANIRTVDENIPFKATHASRGKAIRAEPISALYEQGRGHHVGFFPYLEDELCDWVPGESKSPNRLDALVWAITELMDEKPTGLVPRSPLPEEKETKEQRSYEDSLFGDGEMPQF